uniref:COR domain-containing protein n=1 Tax=Aplanochytrium stocchinoi TaxID=215587 RepID=A0A7S3PE57_9STRA
MEEKGNLRLIDKILRELTNGSFEQIVFPDNIEHGDLIFFPIDNKERLGIDRLRRAVEHCARDDPVSSQEVSIRWMAFLDRILSEKQNETKEYLTFSDEVKIIGAIVGIPSVGEQEEALSFFHERGFLIHMTSTEILKNIVIIKPQWLIDALSKVICEGNMHINMDQFKQVGLENDAQMTYARGLASRDFLEYIWKGEQVEFFIDLMKRTMLLSEWDRESYLVPSLLRDTYVIPKAGISGHRCVYDFSLCFLPSGVFQRLLCLCVELSSRSGGNTNLKLYKNFASIKLKLGVVHLLENTEAQTISVYVEKAHSEAKILNVIQSMLLKVNHDVMGAGLAWSTYVENTATKELVRLSEAQEQKLSPWFNSDDQQETEKISSQSVDLDTFLENL